MITQNITEDLDLSDSDESDSPKEESKSLSQRNVPSSM
jgi:hypothetical protein